MAVLSGANTDLSSDLSNDIDWLEGTVLTLKDYLSAVQLVVDETFAHRVWVKAEIRHLASKGGHYYLELAQKDEAHQLVASCRATLWRSQAPSVLAKFARMTGMNLQADLTVLISVQARVHPLYGLSLQVHDIDPSYTLGELAHHYAMMKERLIAEGLLDANKRHAVPFDLQDVIVIAPKNAAGLEDFQVEAERLAQCGACRFHYHHATFQSNDAPQQIRNAITTARRGFVKVHGREPDLLVIIRGGGAKNDLGYLNDYELAALVAEQPYPVWVGIGHERDEGILDEVAHTRFGTPSKVIQGIITHLSLMLTSYKQVIQQLQEAINQQLSHAQRSTSEAMHYITNQSRQQLTDAEHRAQRHLERIQTHARFCLNVTQQQINLHRERIHLDALQRLTHQHDQCQQLYQTVRTASFRQIDTMRQRIWQHRAITLGYDPKHTMARGFTVVRTEAGKLVTHASQLTPDMPLLMTFYQGQATATVVSVQAEDSTPYSPPHYPIDRISVKDTP